MKSLKDLSSESDATIAAIKTKNLLLQVEKREKLAYEEREILSRRNRFGSRTYHSRVLNLRL